ncbi:MAG: hypothetical protein LBR11_05460 [Deltaproteobacteria bacterium]|jgi:hypothetical protein|nr:hypothetical protein [Deltaproteobacteria bacterium]
MSEDLAKSNGPGLDATESSTIISQAAQDLANGRDQMRDLNTLGDQPKVGPAQKKSPVKTMGWFLLYILSLFILVFWSAISFIHDTPYAWSGLVLALATLLVSIPTFHFISLPARASLAGIGLALALALTSLYNPEAQMVPGLSFPILWATTLILAWIVVFWVVWRSYGREKPGIAILLSFALFYPILGSGLSLFHSLSLILTGTEGPDLTLAALNRSPARVTQTLPTFLWPQALMGLLIPLLAALFAFKAQLAKLLRKKPPLHFAPFFYGLAFLILLIPGFLAFRPLSENTELARGIRGVYRDADFYYSTNRSESQKATAGSPAETTPAEVEKVEPSPIESAQVESSPATPAPSAETKVEPVTSEPAPPADAKVKPATSEPAPPAETKVESTTSEPTPPAETKVQPALAVNPEEPKPVENNQDQASSAPEGATPTAAKTAEPNKASVEPKPGEDVAAEDSSSAVLVVEPTGDANQEEEKARDLARSELIQRLSEENDNLEKANAELNRKLNLLQNENQLLRERLDFSDQLLNNLTTR